MNKEWLQATSEGNVDNIRALLAGGQNVDARDEHGQTALMNAARVGHEQVIQVFVGASADLNATAKYNLTALMLAIINGHTQIAEFLVKAGADVAVCGALGHQASPVRLHSIWRWSEISRRLQRHSGKFLRSKPKLEL
jgi:ankyrin repeat protein